MANVVETKVKVQKVNSGVQFTILNARTGKPVSRKITERDRRVLFAAFEWYCGEVNKVALEHNVYLGPFDEEYSGPRDCCASFLALEPWGFADGTFEAPVMGDSGSFATDARARRLLCYQAPLNRIKAPGYFLYERVIPINLEGV